MADVSAPPPAPASGPHKVLGRLELTQQPERVFYKDEGGSRSYYLFVFFVLRAARTDQLKCALDSQANGRCMIPVECELLYDVNDEVVADSSALQLLGNSRDEKTDKGDGRPEFDPSTCTGSVRYRINKASVRKDSVGFRIRVSLRGLKDVITPAISESTFVLSKRKSLRMADRIPEQQMRDTIEGLARTRNFEVEERLAREPPGDAPLIHHIGPEAGFTRVPPFPALKLNKNRNNVGRGGIKRPLRLQSSEDAMSAEPSASPQHLAMSSNQENDSQKEIDELRARVEKLEDMVRAIDSAMSTGTLNSGAAGPYVPGKGSGLGRPIEDGGSVLTLSGMSNTGLTNAGLTNAGLTNTGLTNTGLTSLLNLKEGTGQTLPVHDRVEDQHEPSTTLSTPADSGVDDADADGEDADGRRSKGRRNKAPRRV